MNLFFIPIYLQTNVREAARVATVVDIVPEAIHHVAVVIRAQEAAQVAATDDASVVISITTDLVTSITIEVCLHFTISHFLH